MLANLRRRILGGKQTYTCHFCGKKSMLVPPYGTQNVKSFPAHGTDVQVSSGTPARWYCSACEAWNHTDKDGHVLDTYDPALGDTVHQDSMPSMPRATLFCRTCVTNQTLVTNLVANYLHENATEAEDAAQMEAFPAYRKSLEQRYPLACAACAQRANEHIVETDCHVQQALLGAWVKNQVHKRPQEAKHTTKRNYAWYWKGVHCLIVHTVGIACSLLWASGRTYPWLLPVACMPPVGFDPVWYKAKMLRLRQVPFAVHGQLAWRMGECALWAVRILIVVGIYGAWYAPRVGLALALVQCLTISYTLRGCTVQSMRPVHLVSTKVPLPSFSAHQGDPLAAMSLGRARPAPPLDTLLETTKEEAMEIDPLPEPTPHLVFGPQRFAGPETQSGLEDLFHSKLALESDMCIAQDAAHGWMTVNMPLAFVVLGVGALLWYGLRVQ